MTTMVPESTLPTLTNTGGGTDYLSAFQNSQGSGSATSSSGSTASTSDAMPGGSLSALPYTTSVTGQSSIAPESDPITAPATSSLAQNTSTKNVVVGGVVILVVIVGGYYLVRSKLDIIKDVIDIGDHVKKHL